MKKLLIEAIIFPFAWLNYTVRHTIPETTPDLLKELWGFLKIKIKFDIHTFIGIGLLIYFYLIMSGRVDSFQGYRHGLEVLADTGGINRHGSGGVFIGAIFGIPLILFGRSVLVFIGYLLVAMQWLIMVSFETPQSIKPPPKTAYIIPSSAPESLGLDSDSPQKLCFCLSTKKSHPNTLQKIPHILIS